MEGWGCFSSQETLKILISSKKKSEYQNHLSKEGNSGLKEASVFMAFFFLAGLFPLSLFLFFHGFIMLLGFFFSPVAK